MKYKVKDAQLDDSSPVTDGYTDPEIILVSIRLKKKFHVQTEPKQNFSSRVSVENGNETLPNKYFNLQYLHIKML